MKTDLKEVNNEIRDEENSGQFTTRGKATLAAIDAALEYLDNKK